VTAEQLADWAEMSGVECAVIGADTSLSAFRNELRWNEIAWRLR
jgi:L-arabinose isomerase